MFYQIFFSLQVKRCAIITYEHGIYEYIRILENGEISWKSQNKSQNIEWWRSA